MVWVSHWMEVRVQFTRVASLHVGLWDEIQVVSLNRKYLYLLSHLTFLQIFIAVCLIILTYGFIMYPMLKLQFISLYYYFSPFIYTKTHFMAYTIVFFSECYIWFCLISFFNVCVFMCMLCAYVETRNRYCVSSSVFLHPVFWSRSLTEAAACHFD